MMSKKCKGCDAIIVRQPEDKDFKWSRKKYCSGECSAKTKRSWGHRKAVGEGSRWEN